MRYTASVDDDQIIISKERWGRLIPELVLSLAEAADLYLDLGQAVRAAKGNDLERKKSRLVTLQAEVARLEAATL